MWACRWFPRLRPRAVLSQLHPVRRHAVEPPAGKGKSSTASAGRDRRRNPHRKQHLYLVLDDAKDGAGIHKLDMDAPPMKMQRLPEPPLVRIAYRMAQNFSVLGRHVIGTGCANRQSYSDTRGDGDTVTFDTKTSALAVLPDLPMGICNSTAIVAVAVGNMLYVIDNGSALDRRPLLIDGGYFRGGLQCLRLQPEDGKQPSSRPNKAGWDWDWETSLDDYSPTRWHWGAHHRQLPLSSYDVTATAVHPNGRALFVSAGCGSDCNKGTFSYSTESGRWARHGDWELPFVGQGHCHTGLRAWAGLHGDSDGYLYLCSCDVPRHSRRRARAAPGWKLGKEKLFNEDPKRHVDAKLVDMGGGRFCLVEMLTREGVSWKERLGDGDRCVLRLTTFRVEYGDDGELTTTDRRPARSYKLSSHRGGFHWQAFWA